MVRSMQLRCKELTVVVPDMAKSAATILCLGAHHILMGPGGDLGPIDPQMIFPGEDGMRTAVSAKEIVAAIGEAEERIRAARVRWSRDYHVSGEPAVLRDVVLGRPDG